MTALSIERMVSGGGREDAGIFLCASSIPPYASFLLLGPFPTRYRCHRLCTYRCCWNQAGGRCSTGYFSTDWGFSCQ